MCQLKTPDDEKLNSWLHSNLFLALSLVTSNYCNTGYWNRYSGILEIETVDCGDDTFTSSMKKGYSSKNVGTAMLPQTSRSVRMTTMMSGASHLPTNLS